MDETEAEEVMESAEVVEQRVRDLTDFVKAHLSGVFKDTMAVTVKSESLMLVLSELDEEFTFDDLHGRTLVAWMCQAIAYTVEPLTHEVVDEYLENFDVPGGSDGTLSIHWVSGLPIFAGPIGQLEKTVAWVVVAHLNAVLWEDPSWEAMADGLNDTLSDSFELFYGMFGLIVLYYYIKIVDDGLAPAMSFE